ncbi:unnamed protein product [Litomosoides sigmodontis]|uniref:BHLH domain-containing protein n=1 Tax=Litomosoides sigmodontis TaxID=42156 RepID=A0A3P6TKA2_LITSI|nr:unnamed protein product [Litomosoides sigmodontis]
MELCLNHQRKGTSWFVVFDVRKNKAEIERRRRARMNASLNQLKMFHLVKSPKLESKLEKIEILDLTIQYLLQIVFWLARYRESSLSDIQLFASYPRALESEKMAYAGFRDGFQAAQKATTSFIYNRCHPSISSPLVASVNAELASVFDQSFKSMKWLRSIYGSNVTRENQHSSASTTEMNFPQFGQQLATNFIPQSHSTPIIHLHNIPPLFESPESASSNQSLSHSLSLSAASLTLSSAAAKESEESLDESNSTAEFICIICEGTCHCSKK